MVLFAFYLLFLFVNLFLLGGPLGAIFGIFYSYGFFSLWGPFLGLSHPTKNSVSAHISIKRKKNREKRSHMKKNGPLPMLSGYQIHYFRFNYSEEIVC